MKYMFETDEIKCCGECPIACFNQHDEIYRCSLMDLYVDLEGLTPEWCPLIEVGEGEE